MCYVFSVQEFMTFTSQLIVERSAKGSRASVKEQGKRPCRLVHMQPPSARTPVALHVHTAPPTTARTPLCWLVASAFSLFWSRMLPCLVLMFQRPD